MLMERAVIVRARAYRVIPVPHAALVSSARQQGGWHVVRDGQCDCPSYLYRRHCVHLDAVAAAPGVPEVVLGPAVPTERPLCRECGREPVSAGRQECANCLLYGR